MEEQEQKTTKVPVGANIDPAIAAVITTFATEDERSVSNTIERLLKTHPRVQEIMEPATAAVGN